MLVYQRVSPVKSHGVAVRPDTLSFNSAIGAAVGDPMENSRLLRIWRRPKMGVPQYGRLKMENPTKDG